jgi:Uma2 family endonuclease
MGGRANSSTWIGLEEARRAPHASSMSDRSKRKATDEDLAQVAPTQVGEIVDGELYVSPRPASAHANAAGALYGELYGPFRQGRGGPGGWLILPEPELRLGADALVPDVAGWRRERMPHLPLVPAFTLAPDWVCEVFSPSTETLDREKKMPVYAREGVRHLWLVDPLQQSLEVYRLEGPRWSQQGSWRGTGTVHAEPFESLALELAALWQR